MAYTDEQREFYKRAKAAEWPAEKIRAGLQRLETRAAPQPEVDIPAPDAALAAMPAQEQPDNNAAFADRSKLDQFLLGGSSELHGLVTGAKQLLGVEGADEEAKRIKAIKEITGDTAAGKTGQIGANVLAALLPGGAATKAAQYGLPAAIAAEGALGAGMGALAPTTEEGERAENVALGGALGAAIPAAGAGIRKLVGQADPAMQKAAQTLQKYGIKTSKADTSPGLISKTGEYILEKSPGTNQLLTAQAAGKNEKVADALFGMLGKETPTTNEQMSSIVQDIGADIGKVSRGKKVPVSELKAGVDDVMKEYNKLLPAQKSKRIVDYGKQLKDLVSIKGAKLKGEAYQAIRSDMATEAAGATPADAKALRGMVKVLDDQFAKTLTPEEQAAQQLSKQRYRLANILKNVDIKEGKIDIGKTRAAVERAARKGAVMPEARELLSAADMAIPKVKGNLLTSGPAGTVAALMNPAIALKIAGLGAVPRGILATGVPQSAANSPFLRKATARALRGVNQEIVDED